MCHIEVFSIIEKTVRSYRYNIKVVSDLRSCEYTHCIVPPQGCKAILNRDTCTATITMIVILLISENSHSLITKRNFKIKQVIMRYFTQNMHFNGHLFMLYVSFLSENSVLMLKCGPVVDCLGCRISIKMVSQPLMA